MKLMKTTSHLSTSIYEGQNMAASQVMQIKQDPVVPVPNPFNLNQTQPISKMKLDQHRLEAEDLIYDHRGQQASCSNQIVGTEHDAYAENHQGQPEGGQGHEEDQPYQEGPEERDDGQLEENEDMDFDLMLGHYEYQNFTDQVIESKSHQDEVEKDALNYFKIQKDNGMQMMLQNQELKAQRENEMGWPMSLNEDGQRSRQKNLNEQQVIMAKASAAQTQQLTIPKRSILNSKRLSTQMGEGIQRSNSGQYSHQRPSSQADVSLPSAYQKNLMALHGQLTDSMPENHQPYDQKTKAKNGLGSEQKSRALGGQSQNNFATGNVAMVSSQVDVKKKAQNLKGHALQKLNPNRAIQTLKPQGPTALNVSGQIPPNMIGGIRNKFNKNMEQLGLQAPAESSLNKKKRSNSRQKQRSIGATQSAFNPNGNIKQQKLSRNNNNDHFVARKAHRGTEKVRKSSLYSQGSQPGQTQLAKAIDSNAVDIKTMLNESQKIASAMVQAHDSITADPGMQQMDVLAGQANRLQNPSTQPLTSSKVDLIKMMQKPLIVDQALNDSHSNLASQALNKRAPATKNIQKQQEQPNIINAQTNGKKVKIAKSTKQPGQQAIARTAQQKKVANVQQPRQRVSSTDNQAKVQAQGNHLRGNLNGENNAQGYLKVMKTLMDLCNQTQNIRNINDNYRQQVPQQMQLVNDYSSQDNAERMGHQGIGDVLFGADKPGKAAVSQSHNFKNAKQKIAGQVQARNATLSNSRRASNVFLSQQSKEDMPVLNNMQNNLGSLDQNQEDNQKPFLGSSTGTINYRGGGKAGTEIQNCAQPRLQSQQMSKLQSGVTTQLLHDQQAWGTHQQTRKSTAAGRGAFNKSPNQPQSLLNTSSNLHDFLKNNKLSIVSQNLNHGVGGGLGSTYAPGGLGFGQIRTLMKLPTFQSSQVNNYGKTIGNFAAHRILKAAQAARGSYHLRHESSGNHSSLLGTLKGGTGIMPNLSNAEFTNENLNESMRDFEMALEHFAGSTGNMQNVLQRTNNQGHIVAGGLDNLRGNSNFNGTEHITFAKQMKLSGLLANFQEQKAEPESGRVTITNNEATIQEPDSESQKRAQKTYQLSQQPLSNLQIHRQQDPAKKQAFTSETQQLQENPLLHELFPEAVAAAGQTDDEFINTDHDEEKNEYRGQEEEGYDSDTDQSAGEHVDGQNAKDQFYQVQKLHLRDAGGLEGLVDGSMGRFNAQDDQAYRGDLQMENNTWQKMDMPNNIKVKPKFRDNSSSSQKGAGLPKAGAVHLIPKQLVQAAKGQAQRAMPQQLAMNQEGLESEQQLKIKGLEDAMAKSNLGRYMERLSSSGSNVKRSGPPNPHAPKASGTSLLRWNSKQGGAAKGSYSTAAKREMTQEYQINKNSSTGQGNEQFKVSPGQQESRVRTTAKPQRLSGGVEKESEQSLESSASRGSEEANSQSSRRSVDSGGQPPKMINMNAASNLERAKDATMTHYQSRSPLNSGSKLLKKAMRDIKLENNINLRESEKDISGGVSAASDIDDRQGDQRTGPSHNSDVSGDSANDMNGDEEQVYNDKYYEMNQKQSREKTTLPKQDREATRKRIEQLREDLDEKMKDRYQPYRTGGGHQNDRGPKNKDSNSQFSKQNSNTQILIDHNSAYNPSQVGDAEDGVAAQENRVHNYQFGRQIGEGAYAVVRSATSRDDNQKYAIKIYDKSKLSDINRQRSVRREVVLLQKMNHPNIVKLVEAFETDSHVYLVMENVTGGSLHSYLKDMINKQLDEEEARRIFQQILIALKYCHSKCIAHRDIKLENVLLDENKNVKLIDFGFSTCIPNHKKIRMFCGTPSYMAPQIVSKVEYAGPPADIWATGVLLYALLNGCFPFRGQTDDDLYRRIKRGTYHIYNQKVTREYLDILQRCLDVNDDTRPSAKDLLDDPWFKINDIKQKAYEEEKRQFKAKILAKVPIIKKTNHTICILAQNPTDVLSKAVRNENEPAQIQQEDEQKNITTPADSNANQNQAYNPMTAEESPCMGQGLQGTQARINAESQSDQIRSGDYQPATPNVHANAASSAQSSQLNLLPYQNNFNTEAEPSDPQPINNGASDSSANGADYKDQVVQQNLGKAQQKLTVGVYEGNLIGGTGIPSSKPDGFPRTIILNQNQASLLGGPGIQGQDPAGSAILQQPQASASSAGQPGAIVLSYGAAVAPQIHVYQLKKKLNHEAYQAYYNTSSATGGNSTSGTNPALARTAGPPGGPPPLQGISALGPMHLNVQSSPMAGPAAQPHNNNKTIN